MTDNTPRCTHIAIPMVPPKLPPCWFYNACRLEVGNGRRDVEQHEATTVVANGRNRVRMRALVPLQATAAAHVRL